MWSRNSHVLTLLAEAEGGPKDRRILWNDPIEDSFSEIKCIISYETLMNYTYFNISFKVHNDMYLTPY